nr:hypothetical protein [Tanacetum cinerariifolium]
VEFKGLAGKLRLKMYNVLNVHRIALSEAEQIKIATKRSRTQFHVSHASGSGAHERTGVSPGVPDVPTYGSNDEQISWKSSDDEDNNDADNQGDDDEYDDDDDDADNQDDHDQDDEDEQTEFDNDDDIFEEKLDEEKTNEEKEVDELYSDVNINLEGRDIEMTDASLTNVQATQVRKDTHVIISAVTLEVQQQSSLISSGFISNMLNPNPDTGIDFILNLNTESTSLVDVLVTANPEIPPSYVTTLPPPPIPLIQPQQQTLAPSPTIIQINEPLEAEVLTHSSNEAKTSHAVAANLSKLELKKFLIDKMKRNKSIYRSDQQKTLYKPLIDAYETDKVILDTYGDTVGKGFFGVDRPLFEGMLVAQEVGEDANEVHAKDVNAAGVVAEGAVVMMLMLLLMNHLFHHLHHLLHHHNHLKIYLPLPKRVEHLELDKISQAIEITKLKQRVKKLERRNKLKVLKLRRFKKVGSAQTIDTSDDTVMDNGRKAESQAEIYKIDVEHAKKVLSMQEEESEAAELQEVVDVVTTAKIITKVVTAASDTITAADVPILAATIAVAPTHTSTPSRRRKGVVIKDLEETTTTSIIIHSKAKSKDKCKGILRKQKEDKAVKGYKVLKRKPHTEAQAMKNMMIYLRNVDGFKIDYFKGMNYDDIRLIYEKHFDSNVDVVTTSTIITEVVTTASDTITAADVLIPAATIGTAPTLTAAPSRRRKGIDYFNGMTYDDIRPIFEKHFDSNVAFQQKTKEQMDEEDNRALKRLNESQEEKAAKK